jgi:hypothetical protein
MAGADPRLAAQKAHSSGRQKALDVAWGAVQLHRYWLAVAWRGSVSVTVGFPVGSQQSGKRPSGYAKVRACRVVPQFRWPATTPGQPSS